MVMIMVVANPIPEPGYTGLLVRKDDFSSKQESRVGAELEKREVGCNANAYWNQNIAGFSGKITNGPSVTQYEHSHHHSAYNHHTSEHKHYKKHKKHHHRKSNSIGANAQVE
ncbi:hypothetical protein BGZ49_004151 [Haplosporangium sp. Z 27]|nr:hypothetical protein BGZ49_004151 [Haplosporangium sp. Z 27]